MISLVLPSWKDWYYFGWHGVDRYLSLKIQTGWTLWHLLCNWFTPQYPATRYLFKHLFKWL